MSDLVGRQLGKYTITGVLGSGAMAIVYGARDKLLERDVAVKVIRAELLGDSDFLERFRREARAAARLDHPNIVPIYELSESDGMVFFVTPIVAGGTLKERLQQGPVTIKEVQGIARQLASALDFAHRCGIVHRDLKPSNVLLDGAGNAYLMDFGVAKMLDSRSDRTMVGSVIGTPTYMSPEALLGKDVDARADVYALAVIVFEMLAGTPPFQADSIPALMHAQLNADRPSVRDLRPELSLAADKALTKALSRERGDRFRTAGEFVDAMFGADVERPETTGLSPTSLRIGVGPDGERAAASNLPRKSPWLVVTVIAIAATLLLVASSEWPLPRLIEGLGSESESIPMAYALGLLALVAAIPVLTVIVWRRRRHGPTSASRVPREAEPRPTPLTPDGAARNSTPEPEFPDRTILEPSPPLANLRGTRSPQPQDATLIIPAPIQSGPSVLRPAVALAIVQCADAIRVGTKIPIEQFPFSVGRGDSVELSIPGDRALSRVHAIIDHRAGQFIVRDAGSTNGVYVNGAIVASGAPARLLFNDVIRLSAATSLMLVSTDIVRLPDLIGRIVDRQYKLVELIYASDKSAIYVAENQRLPQRVALKVFSPVLAAYPDYREQFSREAEIAASLHHPHIRKILGYGQTECALDDGNSFEATYLCMELMEGGSLADRLAAKETVPARQLADWVRKLADALDYTHGEGVVHAGIKPSAVVFDRGGNPYLTDFAIASHQGKSSGGTLAGAPAFLAPEQWERKDPTPATDQYALAALVYLVLTGERPYAGQEDPDVRARNYRSGPPPASQEAARHGRSDVPPGVSHVLARALANDPGERFASVGHFARALEQALAGRLDGEPCVFLSYQRDASAGWATLIARELQQQHGIRVFLDTQRLDAVGRFPDRLKHAIETSDVFVCLLARETLESEWVREEIRIASEGGRPMVPVFQETFEPSLVTGIHSAAVEDLLRYDGVHLLDRRNIHIEHTISDLARIIGHTVKAG